MVPKGCGLLGEGGVGDDAVAESVDRLPGSVAQRTGPGGVGDLPGEVEHLLHPPDEVPGGQVGLGEDLVGPGAVGPPVRRPGEPEVRFPQEVQPVVAFELVEVGPQRHHPGDDVSDSPRWQPR